MANVASETYTSTSAPIQYAAVRAFQGGSDIENYLLHSRRILKALGRWITARLQESGISLASPEGGFYLFPDFGPVRDRLRARGIGTSDELSDRLRQDTGVAILPGSAFGRPADELTARIAYVDFDGTRVLAASQQIPLERDLDEEFLETYCTPSLEGVNRIRGWVE
jgi:aspartate aminotransferase